LTLHTRFPHISSAFFRPALNKICRQPYLFQIPVVPPDFHLIHNQADSVFPEYGSDHENPVDFYC
jgi:hypothetical protein